MKNNITKLKKEIKVKDFIIRELFKVVTEAGVKIPDVLLRNLSLLYGVEDEGKEKGTDSTSV